MPAQAIMAPLSVQSFCGGAREGEARGSRRRLEPLPQGLVGGDPPGRDERAASWIAGTESGQRMPGAVGEHVGDSGLEARGEIGRGPALEAAIFPPRVGTERLDGLPDRGLEAREGEVAAGPAEERPRQPVLLRVAFAREALDRRSAGIAEAQELRAFVEGLADRVVERGAEPLVAADPLDGEQLAVAARDEEQEIGKRQLGREARGKRVALEMVDGEEGLAGDGGDRLCRGDTDDDAADEARPAGRGDAVELGET